MRSLGLERLAPSRSRGQISRDVRKGPRATPWLGCGCEARGQRKMDNEDIMGVPTMFELFAYENHRLLYVA